MERANVLPISEFLQRHRLYDIKAIDRNGNTALHLAMADKKFTPKQTIEILGILLDVGLDLNLKNRKNETVLHLAMGNRAKDAVDLLIKRKLALDPTYFRQSVILCLVETERNKMLELGNRSCEMSDMEVRRMESESAHFAEWLMSKGLKIIGFGEHALAMAVCFNLHHIVPILLKHTDAIDSCNRKKNEATLLLRSFLWNNMTQREYQAGKQSHAWYCSYSERHAPRVVEVLLSRGASPEVIDGGGNTALHLAIKFKEDVRIVKMLIEHSARVDRKNCLGKAPLYLAIDKWLESTGRPDPEYYVQISRAMLSKGADIGELAYLLCKAVQKSDRRVIEFFGEVGADFEASNKEGESLMHLHVKRSECQKIDSNNENVIFDILMSNGCQLNAKERAPYGNTPLHLAARIGNEAMIRRLVEHGADVNCRNNREETPLHYLFQCVKQLRARANTGSLLLELGANVNSKDSSGNSALSLAISFRKNGNAKMLLKSLLEHGADPSEEVADVRANLHLNYRTEFGKISDAARFITIGILLANVDLQFLLEHSVKMTAAKLDRAVNVLINITKYRLLYNKCLQEIVTLKSTFIDSRTSLYSFLHMDLNRRRIHVHNDKLRSLVRCPELEKTFPQYAVIILASYNEAVTRKSISHKAIEAWHQLTDIVLPDICLECIFSFLSNSDLFVMIEQT